MSFAAAADIESSKFDGLGVGGGVLLLNDFFSIWRSMMRTVSHFFREAAIIIFTELLLHSKTLPQVQMQLKAANVFLPPPPSLILNHAAAAAADVGDTYVHLISSGQEGGEGILRHMLPSLSSPPPFLPIPSGTKLTRYFFTSLISEGRKNDFLLLLLVFSHLFVRVKTRL